MLDDWVCRKNKTLRSVLTTKTVLTLLEQNYRTFMALQGGSAPAVAGTAAAGAAAAAGGGGSTPAVDMKAIVEKVLDETEMSQKRAAKMDQDDFLL